MHFSFSLMKLLSLKCSGLLLSEKIHRIIALLIPNRRTLLMSRKNQRLFRKGEQLFPNTLDNLLLTSAKQIGSAVGFRKKGISAEEIGRISLYEEANGTFGMSRSRQHLPLSP